MTDHDGLMKLLVRTLGLSRVLILRLPEKAEKSSNSRDTDRRT
jgi:hypothetical protein